MLKINHILTLILITFNFNSLYSSEPCSILLLRKLKIISYMNDQLEHGWKHYEDTSQINEREVELLQVEKLKKAANKGDASAQYNLGVLHEKGLGVPKDYTEALKWYYKAAEQEFVKAFFGISLIYHNGGYGVSQSDKDAVEWWRKAKKKLRSI